MNKLSESQILQQFREHIDRETLTDDIKVIYRIAGGMPSERQEEEFRLSGSGKAEAMSQDILRSIPSQQVSEELEPSETRGLFRQIGSVLDSLVPRSEAKFMPDSAVGSITIEIGGEEATFYFLADEEERLTQEKPITPQAAEAIQNFRGISERLLERERRRKE